MRNSAPAGADMTPARVGAIVAAMSHAIRTPPRPPSDAQRRYALAGQPIDVAKLAAGLHIVATPIGNLGDITLARAGALAGADLIACEDTRVTRKLLDRYAVTTPLTPYHEHNAAEARPMLLDRIAGGAAIALVSDAGTPLISDPGFKLVRAAQEAGHKVTALPGASRCLRRWRSPGCLPTSSSSPAFCRRSRPRGAPASPNSPASRRRWCCSRAARALPPRLADLAAGLGQPRSRAVPRTHQAARGNPPRRPRRPRAKPCADRRAARRNRRW